MASPDQSVWPPRNSPPIDPQLGAATIFSPEISKEQGIVMPQTGWQEPPLRAAQPSFMDHGGDRVPVLEGMMPLGTYPTARVKAKAKADPLRRAMHARTVEGVPVDDLRSTPDRLHTGDNTPATSLLAEEQSSRPTPATEDLAAPQEALPPPPPATAAPENGYPVQQDFLPLPQHASAPPPHVATSPFSFPDTHGHHHHPPPPADFMGQPFQVNQSSLMSTHPIDHFEYGIRNAMYVRPDLTSVIGAIHAAANKDPEFKTLLAAQAQKQGPTPEQAKALRKKVRRFKKAWHRGQAAIQNSTFGTVDPPPADTPPSQQAQVTPATMNNTAFTTNSIHSMGTMGQPTFAEPPPSHQQSTTPTPHTKSTGPTLKLKLTQSRLSPSASNRPSHSLHSQRTVSPLRQTSNLSESATVVNQTMSTQHPAVGRDSDLSSVDEDITNQDQSTFLQMGGVTTRAQNKKRARSPEPAGEQRSNKRREVSSSADVDGEGPRSRYARATITDKGLKIQPSSLRSTLSSAVGPYTPSTAPSDPQPASSSDEAAAPDGTAMSPAKQRLKLPLAHLDPGATTTTDLLATKQIPTALGRPKKIKAPKIKIPNRATAEDRNRRAVLAGKPELHDNNRPRDASGRPTSSSGSSENSDYCAACGGDGYLLCCDGTDCHRSFHFDCVYPPVSDKEQLGESWFCEDCAAKQRPPPDQLEDTIWGPLLAAMSTRNSVAFSLPASIRNRYPNVTTTNNGEYYETTIPERSTGRRTNAANHTGDPPVDYYRTHDQYTGKRILCYQCGAGARQPDRQIVQCDYCSAAWHMDCLDPPRTHHPHRWLDNKYRHAWMCPLHAQRDLMHIDSIDVDGGVRQEVPTHKIRVPKDPRAVRTVRSALRYGVPNNGNIDVVFEDDDLTQAMPPLKKQRRQEDDTIRYQLSEGMIVMDFIHKAKANRVKQVQDEYWAAVSNMRATSEAQLKNAQAALRREEMLEQRLKSYGTKDQQAALRLVQMAAGGEQKVDMGPTKLDGLVNMLIAEAPEGVVDEGAEDQKMSDEDFEALEKLQANIESMMEKERTKRSSAARGKGRAAS